MLALSLAGRVFEQCIETESHQLKRTPEFSKKTCHTVTIVFSAFYVQKRSQGNFFYHCEALEKLYKIYPCGVLFG